MESVGESNCLPQARENRHTALVDTVNECAQGSQCARNRNEIARPSNARGSSRLFLVAALRGERCNSMSETGYAAGFEPVTADFGLIARERFLRLAGQHSTSKQVRDSMNNKVDCAARTLPVTPFGGFLYWFTELQLLLSFSMVKSVCFTVSRVQFQEAASRVFFEISWNSCVQVQYLNLTTE